LLLHYLPPAWPRQSLDRFAVSPSPCSRHYDELIRWFPRLRYFVWCHPPAARLNQKSTLNDAFQTAARIWHGWRLNARLRQQPQDINCILQVIMVHVG
jgi:hypothetical protein